MESASVPAPTRRVRLLVAYDGRGFHGFAANVGVRTVMGDLAAAIATIVRQPVELTGAGRTDAGVHAWGQVVSGDVPGDVDLDDLVRRLNKLCAPRIAVRSASWAAADFDARFSALWRHYRYEVWNAPTPHPLLVGTAWWVKTPLDLAAMQSGADAIVGEHDFASFCRRPAVGTDRPPPSLVRNVVAARWTDRTDPDDGRDDARRLRFEIRANAFCHQMVRSIVGTLVDVGTGRRRADEVAVILAARHRAAAGQVAPPDGLTLWEVGYPATR